MRRRLTGVRFATLFSLFASPAGAQPWTLQQCMQYAVEHSHEVKRTALELDNYRAGHTAALGRFLPEVGVAVGAQYNFGRAIDPETNTYTDVSTFYNGYSASASLPVFDGFSRLNALRAAKAGVLMGHAALRQQQDQTALHVMQAFANALYCEGMVGMAEEKAREASLLLRQTRLLEEVGRKRAADVALVESQRAEADYELTRQRNLLATALLELKRSMAFPLGDTLTLSVSPFRTGSPKPSNSQSEADRLTVRTVETSELLAARYQVQTSRHEWHQARAAWFPTLSMSAGLSTTYFHMLHAETTAPFRSQLRNNMGQFVGATLAIPLFNRLQTLTSIRRAKNNYRMACEAYEQKQMELEKLRREAWQDWQAYRQQHAQMVKKVAADSMAYHLVRRQFEEGLSTAIDLHATSSQLLQSRALLLQCRLMAVVKEQLVRYYNGETIWTESSHRQRHND